MRTVELPHNALGHLYLLDMPGRQQRFEDVIAAITTRNVAQVVCVALISEIWAAAPDYARALKAGVSWQSIHLNDDGRVSFRGDTGEVPWVRYEMDMEDFSGGLADMVYFWGLAQTVAEKLRAGTNILIQCDRGTSRSGTLAAAVLLALGQPLAQAQQTVAAAGARPETAAQSNVLETIEKSMANAAVPNKSN